MIIDKEILAAALLGYEAERLKIEQRISDIRTNLGVSSSARSKAQPLAAEATSARGTAKRKMSASARKRIAAAQRKRWAAFKKAKQAAE
jgi:hypothetical protein